MAGTLGTSNLEGTIHVRWSKNRRHLIARVTIKHDESDGEEVITQLLGWDPIDKEIVTYHFALGGPVVGRAKIVEPGVWEGRSEAVYKGQRVTGTEKTIFEKDKVTLNTKGNGIPDESYVFERVSEENSRKKRTKKVAKQ